MIDKKRVHYLNMIVLHTWCCL